MGLSGFQIKIKSEGPIELDEQSWEAIWSEIVDTLHGWLEEKLPREEEQEVLDVLDELLEEVCEPPTDTLDFFFHDWEVVGEHAGQHWYRLALLACREEISSLLRSHGMIPDLSELEQAGDSTLLALGDGEIYVVYHDVETEVGRGDGAVPMAGLTEAASDVVLKARQSGRCQCSLCS